MENNQKHPMILIVDLRCLFDNETYQLLLRKTKPYMLLRGDTLCNMPLDLRWCRSEWFKICGDISVECNCPVVCSCGMTPDMLGSYDLSIFSTVHFLVLTSDEKTFNAKLMQSDIRDSKVIEAKKTGYKWFIENELHKYPKEDILDVSGMSNSEEAEAIDLWIRNKLMGTVKSKV